MRSLSWDTRDIERQMEEENIPSLRRYRTRAIDFLIAYERALVREKDIAPDEEQDDLNELIFRVNAIRVKTEHLPFDVMTNTELGTLRKYLSHYADTLSPNEDQDVLRVRDGIGKYIIRRNTPIASLQQKAWDTRPLQYPIIVSMFSSHYFGYHTTRVPQSMVDTINEDDPKSILFFLEDGSDKTFEQVIDESPIVQFGHPKFDTIIAELYYDEVTGKPRARVLHQQASLRSLSWDTRTLEKGEVFPVGSVVEIEDDTLFPLHDIHARDYLLGKKGIVIDTHTFKNLVGEYLAYASALTEAGYARKSNTAIACTVALKDGTSEVILNSDLTLVTNLKSKRNVERSIDTTNDFNRRQTMEMVLLEKHQEEAEFSGAIFYNFGWASGGTFITSKTDRGILHSEIDVDTFVVEHSWQGYDDE